MQQPVVKTTLPLSFRNGNGEMKSSRTYLDAFKLRIIKKSDSGFEVSFPNGWGYEKLTGDREGWTMYMHQAWNKIFYIYVDPSASAISFMSLTEPVDPRGKHPHNYYLEWKSN